MVVIHVGGGLMFELYRRIEEPLKIALVAGIFAAVLVFLTGLACALLT